MTRDGSKNSRTELRATALSTHHSKSGYRGVSWYATWKKFVVRFGSEHRIIAVADDARSEIEPRTRRWEKCVTVLDSKSPIQGPWCRFRREARARERHRHCGVDSLKVLDPKRPIREADIATMRAHRVVPGDQVL
jgi:hypothetical protein